MERAGINNLPTSVVIFGASGDLAKRKLVPALYSLYSIDRLQERIIIGGWSPSSLLP